MRTETHAPDNGMAEAVARSLLFYGYGIALCLAFYPVALALRLVGKPRRKLGHRLIAAMGWGLRHICNLRHELRGAEHMPDTPCMIASLHQSSWEIVVFPVLFGFPAMYAKAELFRLPAAGWVLASGNFIATTRNGNLANAKAGLEKARALHAAGETILIFPEGTRNSVPGDASLKSGTAVLYQLLRAPCVPVLVHSAPFWPYRSLIIRSGTVLVEICPPIQPGLPRREFEARLKSELDARATPRTVSSAPNDRHQGGSAGSV